MFISTGCGDALHHLHREPTTSGTKSVFGLLHLAQTQDVLAPQISERLLQAIDGGNLAGAHALAGVVVFLVGLVVALGVADLRLEVVMVLILKLLNAIPVRPLRVCVDVHLNDAVSEGLPDILEGGSGSSVEDKADGLGVLGGVVTELLGDVRLRAAEDLGLKLDVAGTVDSMDVAEGGGDREHVRDGGEGLVDLVNLLGLGVQVLQGDVGVVHAILFSAGDAELHLEEDADFGHAGKVILADVNVLLNGLLREIDHVGGEEGLAVHGVVALRCGKEAVDPGEEGLGTVVGVEDDGNSVLLSQGANVEGPRDGSSNGGLVVRVVKALAGVELRPTRGKLDDDGRVVAAGGFEAGIDAGGGDAVHGGDGVA